MTLPGELDATSLRNPPGKDLWFQRLPAFFAVVTSIRRPTAGFASAVGTSFSSWNALPSASLANSAMIGIGCPVIRLKISPIMK